jgi:transposase
MKFAAQSERFNAEQRSLLEDEIDADLAAVAKEIEQLGAPATPPQDKQQPRRQALPANLPRREIRHEPETTTYRCGCQMKRIGEDVAEKLDYVPPRARMTCITFLSQFSEERGHHATASTIFQSHSASPSFS